jgi:hypothetical protein
MNDQVDQLIAPFVRRGLFASPEQAVGVMARDYMLHQIERQKTIDEVMQAKYGMTLAQFEKYLEVRSATLLTAPNPTLGRAVMLEEEDALTWKAAVEMLQSWLGLQNEVAG